MSEISIYRALFPLQKLFIIINHYYSQSVTPCPVLISVTLPCFAGFIRVVPFKSTITAGINRLNTAVRAVLEQPCSTGGRTGTVRPKQEPTGRTDLSDRSRLVLCDRSQELIGQACPTRRQVLRSDSACPTTGRTRLFEHRSNCRVRPVNAGSAFYVSSYCTETYQSTQKLYFTSLRGFLA
ncbi:hypothetical protein PCASD_22082 [Puccinia coronata f. sp. avenae]|uniref:Uncharacterized protein n=1 Tax=Puccinia coronata f. sp. avenae TaxID=200324 RepID=A0A2N5TYF1_9BASI|nr:hypothetical protein PCASD_22082 [Puccinia coronata f. sp. avenae]